MGVCLVWLALFCNSVIFFIINQHFFAYFLESICLAHVFLSSTNFLKKCLNFSFLYLLSWSKQGKADQGGTGCVFSCFKRVFPNCHSFKNTSEVFSLCLSAFVQRLFYLFIQILTDKWWMPIVTICIADSLTRERTNKQNRQDTSSREYTVC